MDKFKLKLKPETSYSAGSPQARKVETSPWLRGRRRKDHHGVQPPPLRMSRVGSCPSPALSPERRRHPRPPTLGEHASHQALSTKTELWSCPAPSLRETGAPSPGERPRQGRGPSLRAAGSRKSLSPWVQFPCHLPASLAQPVTPMTQCPVGQAGGPATWPISSAHWPRTAKTQTKRNP